MRERERERAHDVFDDSSRIFLAPRRKPRITDQKFKK